MFTNVVCRILLRRMLYKMQMAMLWACGAVVLISPLLESAAQVGRRKDNQVDGGAVRSVAGAVEGTERLLQVYGLPSSLVLVSFTRVVFQ